MFVTRRALGLLAAATLILAACGGDTQGRTRNQALPETSVSPTESDESDDAPTEDTIGQVEAPEETTVNTIVVPDDPVVEDQGSGSSETSAPAQNVIGQNDDGDDEVALDTPDKKGGKQIVSNKISICHATGNGKFVEIAVDPNGLNGHGNHQGDVIPAPAGGCGSIEVPDTTTSTSTTTTTLPKDQGERKWTDESFGVMTVNEFYSDGVKASGPGGVMAYSMSNGTILPPGLALDSKTGGVSGIPTRAGTFSFSMYVSFWGCVCGLGKSFSVTVEEPRKPEVSDPSWTDTGLGLLIEGVKYQDGFSAFPNPQSYSVAGALPPGLTFDASSGAISGTPTKEGSYTFTVTANYQQGKLEPLNVLAVVTPSISKVWVDDTIAVFVLDSPYSDGVQAKGGGNLDGTMRGVMGYTVPKGGALPTGITLDYKSGRLSGTPTQPGPFRFSIYAGFWAGSGLYLEFSGVLGQPGSSPTTVATTTTTVEPDDSVVVSTTDSPVTTTSTVPAGSVGEDGSAGEGTATTTSVDGTPEVVQSDRPAERQVTLVDVVSPNQIVAQVLPSDVDRITCDSGCLQLLITRVGLEKGRVFGRTTSTDWTPLDAVNDSIEFVIDDDVTNFQIKVVGEDGTTYVMQGQTQRAEEPDGSSASSSFSLWWLLLLLVLLLLIARAILRNRRKRSSSAA